MNTATDRYSKNNDLIIRIQGNDDNDAMIALQELIEDNSGLVRSISSRFRDRGCEFDDLIQIGTIGMIKAARSFSIDRGTAFSTYAVPLIMGEIKRHLRDDGPIKVSRVHKKLATELSVARNDIVAREGREPSISELAERCGISSEDAAIAFESSSPITSLSEAVDDDERLTLESRLSSDDNEIERITDKIALGQAISKMPKDWQKIVTLRYFRNMTQQAVAEIMGYSQVKISREEKKIISFLRGELIK